MYRHIARIQANLDAGDISHNPRLGFLLQEQIEPYSAATFILQEDGVSLIYLEPGPNTSDEESTET